VGIICIKHCTVRQSVSLVHRMYITLQLQLLCFSRSRFHSCFSFISSICL